MHILWLVRTTLPQAAAACGLAGASDVSGSWLTGQLAALQAHPALHLTVLCVGKAEAAGRADGVDYRIVTGTAAFAPLLLQLRPDLVHIWGTEYDAAAAMAEAAKDAGTAFVFMGHGTAHVAKVSYSQMSAQMQNLGYENVFIGTVEGEPEETSCESVIEAVKAAGYTNVILRPLMVVAGDHANNDMAGSDDDSWKTMFEAADFTVDCQIAGLGEIADIQALYIAHTQAAIDALNA